MSDLSQRIAALFSDGAGANRDEARDAFFELQAELGQGRALRLAMSSGHPGGGSGEAGAKQLAA